VSSRQLRGYFRACLRICLRSSCELTWERTVNQAGRMPSSAVVSILESMPGSVHEYVLAVLMRILGVS
jgi:hypothetical protein